MSTTNMENNKSKKKRKKKNNKDKKRKHIADQEANDLDSKKKPKQSNDATQEQFRLVESQEVEQLENTIHHDKDEEKRREKKRKKKEKKKEKKEKSRRSAELQSASSDGLDETPTGLLNDAKNGETLPTLKRKEEKIIGKIHTQEENMTTDLKANGEKEKKKKKKKKKRNKRENGEEASHISVEDLDANEESNSSDEKKGSNGKCNYNRNDKKPTKDTLTNTSEEENKLDNYNVEYLANKKARIVSSSALLDNPNTNKDKSKNDNNNITLLLFYQYVEPPWTVQQHKAALAYCQSSGQDLGLTGRMRVAREGLNCTLTATSFVNIQQWCQRLVEKYPFFDTEFKCTTELPSKQRFPKLHVFAVDELVNYGMGGGSLDNHATAAASTATSAPPLSGAATHLEPHEYHEKLSQPDTVVIDVRNHYEAAIGHFVPPSTGATLLDPHMRKSTEFPAWLENPTTQESLKNKQVLMYCTGGVRCERASALLRHKMETDETMQNLGVKGVYQLQGGIDKYFKAFPKGGFWKGKNYVFDKRFAHAPPLVEATNQKEEEDKEENGTKSQAHGKASSHGQKDDSTNTDHNQTPLGRCEACQKPWDMYRGKRRCPTCGVPSLICRDCLRADKEGTKKLDKSIRCVLCVKQGIVSKAQWKAKEKETAGVAVRGNESGKPQALEDDGHGDDTGGPGLNGTRKRQKVEEQKKLHTRFGMDTSSQDASPTNGRNTQIFSKSTTSPPISSTAATTTRLYVGNLCKRQMNEDILSKTLPGVTHVQWLNDRRTGQFSGSCFVEMSSLETATAALTKNGEEVLGRSIKVRCQAADSKDVWPPPCAVKIG